MKLVTRKFCDDYWIVGIGWICEGRGRRRRLKRLLSRARRNDGKAHVKTELSNMVGATTAKCM